MALSFGWRASEKWESIWIDDPALTGVTEAAKQAWEEDGDASHLLPFSDGSHTKITFRSLKTDEYRAAQATAATSGGDEESFLRTVLMCFRLGVDFPDMKPRLPMPDGSERSRLVKERGFRMLDDGFVAGIEQAYPGIVNFYGARIFSASFASGAEKKASSPPSTPTPSSEAAKSQGDTASKELGA